MRVIGLTGGIACGKSTIARYLSRQGAVIVDGDALSRELTAPGGIALPALRNAFGEGIFFPDGTLNRKALGQLVFSDEAQRQRLDDIMQPLLRTLILRDLEAARQSGAALCVLDMPLLFEKNLDALCDTVWCAWLPADLQIQRLMARDGLSQQEALARIASQMPTDEKAARSAVVIDTSGTIQYTESKLPALLAAEQSHSTV